jgi:flagellar motor switch protein FliM
MIQSVRVPVSVDLGNIQISIKELLDLRAGDIINLARPVDKELIVKISDQPKLLAKPGVLNRKKAIKIISKYEE